MITVEEALAKVLALVDPLASESVPLQEAAGRVLAADVIATRDQPPFASSAMDGYALRNADVIDGAAFDVIGESAAGHAYDGAVGPGQAARIFTGAPVPQGADRVVIQEDVTRNGDRITLNAGFDDALHVRPAGGDFRIGDSMAAPRILSPTDIALAAAMNQPTLELARKPDVAIIATGDELVMPGENPAPDQIIASNNFGLKAMFEAAGARARMLPIARDNTGSLETVFDLARGADLIVTIGGASVGDHDLVGQVAREQGLETAFYKVAMRPGKPLMAGRLNGTPMIGLPGNPVSSMVCGMVFILPAIRAMLGLGKAASPRHTATLVNDTGANGPREHYMRAVVGEDGRITILGRQDSSLLSVLSTANALAIRPVGDPARKAGEVLDYLPIATSG
ncbi:MAG: molybdopterin molybdotransferase MoeA [Brevirhabdus sp.]